MPTITFNQKYEPLFKNPEDVFFFFLYSGRGAGKSFAISTYLAIRLVQEKGNLVFCRQYMSNVATSIIPEFLDKIQILGLNKLLKVNKDSITCTTNGNQLFFKGLETAEGTAEASLKGIPKLACVVIDEMQEVKEPAFDRLLGTVRDKDLNLKIICALNPTDVSAWQYKRFFKDLPYNFTGQVDNRYYIYSSYLENLKYLSNAYLHVIEDIKKNNPLKYENQYLGKWLINSQNTLFTNQMIEKAKEKYEEKPFKKIVISIDPAVTVSKSSDATGICVGAKDENNHYVILESLSKRWTPQEWCNIVKDLKMKYRNATIIAEKNNGGLLIQEALHNVGINSVKLVTATKSKILRADDVVVLFEQEKVHFKREFNQLCFECLTYSGDDKDQSPNEMDAMVWTLKELSQSGNSGSLYAQ